MQLQYWGLGFMNWVWVFDAWAMCFGSKVWGFGVNSIGMVRILASGRFLLKL